ncbi:hypothetical protein DVT68_03360 [Dyella solisilvae]|uniref:Uncharacterized protein n=1 Tax=Dyella solisilvae TaxID=1920168 RepID=A0A370KBC6_9GAMM|nr:hypothetical protein [Dyella solisilvae]RDI99879.1 hypothetical protein DVT68_03360 [Dyella solisilvae]
MMNALMADIERITLQFAEGKGALRILHGLGGARPHGANVIRNRTCMTVRLRPPFFIPKNFFLA